MSRHSFTTADNQYDITLGWDAGLSTFFGQVEARGDRGQEEPLLWLGATPHQYPEVEEFMNIFTQHAAAYHVALEFPESLRQQLRAEQEQEGRGYLERPEPIRRIIENG